MPRVATAAIEVDGLVYRYPGVCALDGVGFSLPPASVTALVGPNGAGKTTLLRCLAALEQPYAGRVRVDGHDTLAAPRAVHRSTGFLSDAFGLYRALTVRRNLHYAALSRGLGEADALRRLDAVAAQLNVADLLDTAAGELSRGQRQRVAIAQTIIHEPRVLLLDEPASGLDPVARAELASLMRHLRESGMTIVVSSHILAELDDYSTHMLRLDAGRAGELTPLAAAAQEAGAWLRLRTVEPVVQLAEQVGGLAGVSDLRMHEDYLLFRFHGDAAGRAEMLRTLVERGVAVCEFADAPPALRTLYLDSLEEGGTNAPAGRRT